MIGIVGQGFVGNAIYQKFSKTFPDIKTYDIIPELRNTDSLHDLAEQCEYIFICLPTPMDMKTGRCHTEIIESVLKQINSYQFGNVCIIKSTIPPGTTQMFNEKFEDIEVCFSPEFLTEANAVEDFENQNRIILGGPKDSLIAHVVIEKVFLPVFGEDTKMVVTDVTAAEMVKYTANAFLATKVMFSNEIYELCEKLGIDHSAVVNMVKLDPRIGESHWKVPGPDGDRGFGGHCFPKDVNELLHLFMDNKLNPTVLNSVWLKNIMVRQNKDWQQMEGRAVINTEDTE